MIHPIQKLKNFKNKLSVPIVTEQMLTQNNKLAEQLAKQYEKKLRQLI